MSYQLTWQLPGQVAVLRYGADADMETFAAANDALITILEQAAQPIVLLLDISAVNPHSVAWERTKATQTYMFHRRLSTVLVIGAGNKRLLRLMVLVLFNLSTATLKFLDSPAEADHYLRRYGGFAGAR